ncbi:hypothetical protein tb265_40800 [Gemmatimonadetes bacterium T265]|nr:hypothetical protein tb265_40800 [Gemmatimonadetes bacterium T265]
MGALAKKLLVKPGAVVRVIAAPAGYAGVLDPLPAGATRIDAPAGGAGADDGGAPSEGAPPADVVLAFAHDAAELARLAPGALAALRPGGALWVAYPKGGAKTGTDLTRDRLHDALEGPHGWTGVSLVALDACWSAMRFRPREMMGT